MATSRKAADGPFVALLRGINVGGKRKVPMADLRALAAELGFGDVATYVQSGNLVFAGRGAAAAHERVLEAAIEARFGFPVPVVVRSAAAWRAYVPPAPFSAAAAERPNLLHLLLAKGPLPAGAAAALAPYAVAGERLAIVGDALWADFAGGVARSKLTPAVFDRVVGSTVTARNWNTVQAITALLTP